MNPLRLNHETMIGLVRHLADQLPTNAKIYPVPRGGVPIGYLLLSEMPHATLVDKPELATVFVDDLIDSGSTRDRYSREYPGVPFYAVIEKTDNRWIVFPWEASEIGSGEDIITRLLQFIGEDPNREGLLETPKRVLKAWREWSQGYAENPADIMKTFEDGAQDYDAMVLECDIPAYSHCEHHMAPIVGVAHVAYIPNQRILGLSKMNRLVNLFGRRLQVQERWTTQIADAMWEHLKPKAVGVVIEARHFCVESRGIKHAGCITTTSAMRGAFMEKQAAREELLNLIAMRKNR